MKVSQVSVGHFRFAILLSLGLLSPLFLTQCKSTGGSYEDIEYDPATLKTPSGHGMQKKEYPFDDNGGYRKDWVRNKSTGKVRSASHIPETTLASADASTAGSSAVATSGSYYGPADVGNVASSAATEVVAAAPATPAASEYHKVVSGDTLYSLSRRYGTSVDELKRVNGLTGDSIRTGQSLRVP